MQVYDIFSLEKILEEFFCSIKKPVSQRGRMSLSVTILDVAAHAGVSKATVSRVLNNNPKVNEKIRMRVNSSIEELGYQPNAIARSLANSTSNVISLILPDITNPYFPSVARGIEDEARKYGYSLFISNTDNNPEIEHEYIEKMKRQQVGGIILIASIITEEKVEQLSEMGIPFVLCDRLIDNSPFDTVSIDHYKAAYDVVSNLVQQGHSKIAHISGPRYVQSAQLRRQAYLDAMEAHHLAPVFSIGEFSYESGYRLMTSILEETEITALFAANDLIALGAMNAIHTKGMKVPDHISVVGFDDILFARMSNPTLSSISVPAYEIGQTAVGLLMERIKGVRSIARNLILEHQFIKRES